MILYKAPHAFKSKSKTELQSSLKKKLHKKTKTGYFVEAVGQETFLNLKRSIVLICVSSVYKILWKNDACHPLQYSTFLSKSFTNISTNARFKVNVTFLNTGERKLELE